MDTKKWHVFYTMESTSSVDLRYGSDGDQKLYYKEFETEEKAKDFVKDPWTKGFNMYKFVLKFIIHGDRINPTIRTVEKVHKTLEQEVVWE